MPKAEWTRSAARAAPGWASQTGEAVLNEVITLDPAIKVPLVDLREATASALADIAWTVVSRTRTPGN